MSQPAVTPKSALMQLRAAKALHHPMHKSIYRVAAYSFAISVASVLAFHFGWTVHAGKRDAKFLNEHDPYARMKEICSYPGPRYMVSCPKELVKMAEERGLMIGEPTGPFIPVQKMEEKKEAVESAE